jgi:hypothetical protein
VGVPIPEKDRHSIYIRRAGKRVANWTTNIEGCKAGKLSSRGASARSQFRHLKSQPREDANVQVRDAEVGHTYGTNADWIAWLHGHMNGNLGRLASVPFNRPIAMNFFVKAFFAFRKAFPVISKYLKAR